MTPLLLGQVSRVSQSLMLMSALLLPGQVIAQATPNTIKDVTLQALDSNPEVQAAWRASDDLVAPRARRAFERNRAA